MRARRRGGSPAGRARARASRHRLARSAEQLVYAQLVRDLVALDLKYGLGVDRTPRLDDPDFVSTLVFDPSRGATTPKARFAYLFPSPESAVIQVRLKPGLSDAERDRATALVRRAVAMPDWRLRNARGYTVTGVPVLAEDLADALAGSVLRLLVVAVAVMALVLALVFRRRLRLLPLAVALGAVAVTFGLMALAGAPLTMASIAVLPVLLGLGVDYAIQVQARAAALATIATAALATAAGFLVLALSPVPMVRGFGLQLVVGIGVALLFAIAGATAAPAAVRTRGPRRRIGASTARSPARSAARDSCWRRSGGGCCTRASAGRGACWRWRSCWPRWAGSPTRARRCAPTCPRWSRRTFRPCATSTRCRPPRAWRARSTWSSRGATSPTRPSSPGCAAIRSACWPTSATPPRTAAGARRCAPRSPCPTSSAAMRRPRARASTRCSARCRPTSPRPS